MNVLGLVAYVVAALSFLVSLASTVYFLQSKYRQKLIYQCITVIQIFHMIGLVVRLIYQYEFPPAMGVLRAICVDAVLYGITYFYIGVICVCMNDLHSILASLLFEQFKNMVSTQVKKSNEKTPKEKKLDPNTV
ncbi:hypothetical protein HDV01_001228 [Terramyces sp. JEL0728]|nr:hypothetical protein HDV01_001228 [Terramyces sp. JEL0728]